MWLWLHQSNEVSKPFLFYLIQVHTDILVESIWHRKLATGLEKGFLNYQQNSQLSQQSTFIFKTFLSSQPLSFNHLINRSFDAWHNWRCSFIDFFFFSSLLNDSKFVKWKQSYSFLLQGWLMEHNDQKSCTAILLLQIVKKKIEDEISHCKMYQLFSFSAVLTLKRL